MPTAFRNLIRISRLIINPILKDIIYDPVNRKNLLNVFLASNISSPVIQIAKIVPSYSTPVRPLFIQTYNNGPKTVADSQAHDFSWITGI
jgi:hypothetical protein